MPPVMLLQRKYPLYTNIKPYKSYKSKSLIYTLIIILITLIIYMLVILYL